MSEFSIYITIIYIFSFIGVLCYKYLNKIIGNVLSIILSFFAFILAALRPDYFPDVDTYELVYQQASSGNFTDLDYWITHGEPGFKILAYILHLCNFSYSDFLLFFAVLSFTLLILTAKIAKISFTNLWFLYLSMYYITRDLGIIRVSIASHLIVIALCQKHLISKISTLLFSSITFQYFSLIAILPILLARFKINIKYLILLLPLIYTIKNFVSFDGIIFLVPSIQYETYSSTEQVIKSGGSDLLPIIRNGIFSLLIMLIYNHDTDDEKIRGWIWAALMATLFYIIFSNIPILAQRFSAYCAAILPVALAYKLDEFKRNRIIFLLLIFIVIANYISLFYYNDFVWRGY